MRIKIPLSHKPKRDVQTFLIQIPNIKYSKKSNFELLYAKMSSPYNRREYSQQDIGLSRQKNIENLRIVFWLTDFILL